MPTGQAIVNNALNILTIVELGGTPSATDSQNSLDELNIMWNAWGIDEGLIFAIGPISKALPANIASMTIGVGATWNTPVPSRIYKAFIVNGDNRNEIEVADAERYWHHNSMDASASTPDEVYVDFNIDPTTGYATVYTWPIQTGTPTLELTVGAPFTLWALNTNYNLPQAYQDAIQYALAWRLIPRFGVIVPESIATAVEGLAQKAELRIREMNRVNRQLPGGTEQLVPPPPPVAPDPTRP